MSHWRKEAFGRLPECRRQLQQEKSPNLFWHELGEALYQAHLRRDEDFIRRVYQYAQWCLGAAPGDGAKDDLPTVVTVSFFEHLPTHREVRKEIGRFLPRSLLEEMHEVFLYHGTEPMYQEMLASCPDLTPKTKTIQTARHR
jgi:hypothetical protein